jgi:3-methyladenine DNA glycosylase/8-oxoguanine DNA glycosylase
MRLTPPEIQAARRHLRAAARAIRQRLYELVGPDGLTADNLLRFSPDQLRAVGLSQRKADYVRDLAIQVRSGAVDLRRIGRWSDEQIIRTLTRVKGIGRWTAQMFLIFSLGRPYASVASWYCWRSLDLARNNDTVATGYPT